MFVVVVVVVDIDRQLLKAVYHSHKMDQALGTVVRG